GGWKRYFQPGKLPVILTVWGRQPRQARGRGTMSWTVAWLRGRRAGTMSSRRKRKRSPAEACSPPDGGRLGGDWANASRSDVWRLLKAIRQGWPVPRERRRPVMEAALASLFREDTPVRLVLIARIAVAADERNLGLLERAEINADAVDARREEIASTERRA